MSDHGGQAQDSKPGWYPDPGNPGLERYWNGQRWVMEMPPRDPRDRPQPAWKQARVIALGILIAAAVIFTVWRISQPSDLECLTQQTEVLTGERVAVESACVGR